MLFLSSDLVTAMKKVIQFETQEKKNSKTKQLLMYSVCVCLCICMHLCVCVPVYMYAFVCLSVWLSVCISLCVLCECLHIYMLQLGLWRTPRVFKLFHIIASGVTRGLMWAVVGVTWNTPCQVQNYVEGILKRRCCQEVFYLFILQYWPLKCYVK